MPGQSIFDSIPGNTAAQQPQPLATPPSGGGSIFDAVPGSTPASAAQPFGQPTTGSVFDAIPGTNRGFIPSPAQASGFTQSPAPSDEEAQRMGEGEAWYNKPITTSVFGMGEYRQGAGPIERGLEKFGTGLLSPLNLGLMLVTGGVGGLAEAGAAETAEVGAEAVAPKALGLFGQAGKAALGQLAPATAAKVATAAGVVEKMANLGFTGMQIKSVMDAAPRIGDAIKAGDTDTALEMGTQAALGTLAAGLSTAYLVRGRSTTPEMGKIQKAIAAAQQPNLFWSTVANQIEREKGHLVADSLTDFAAKLYHEAGGDAALLKQQHDALLADKDVQPYVRERVGKALEIAQNLPDEYKAFSDMVRTDSGANPTKLVGYPDFWRKYQEMGIVNDAAKGVEHYAGPNEYVLDDEGASSLIYRGLVERKPKHLQSREHGPIMQAVHEGFEPTRGLVSSYVDYLKQFGRKMAHYEAEQELLKTYAEDGMPVAAYPARNVKGKDAIPLFFTPEEMAAPPTVEAARAAGGKIKLGADVGALGKILGSSLYQGQASGVITKELVQNAMDAVRTTPIKNVHVDLSYGDNAITVKDSGQGMTRGELETVFTDLGASGKRNQAEASGGFGLAKAAPLMMSKKLEVRTVVRENGKLMMHTFTSTPDSLIGDGVNVFTREVPPSTPTGTMVKAYLPDGAYLWRADDYLKGSQLSLNPPADLSYSHDGKLQVKDKPVMPSKEVIRGSIPGANIRLMQSPEVNPLDKAQGSLKVEVHNNGIYQFTDDIYAPQAMEFRGMPTRVAVDVRATVAEGDKDYPFTANREALRGVQKEAIQKLVKEKIIDPLMDKQRETISGIYHNLPRLTWTGTPFFDSGTRLTPEETSKILNDPHVNRISSAIQKAAYGAIKEIQRSERDLGGIKPADFAKSIQRVGLVFADEIHGVFIKDPVNTGHSTIFIDPFNRIPSSPDGAASLIWHTIKHEIVHDQIKGHNESFTSMEAAVSRAIGGKFERGILEDIEKAYADPNDPRTIHPGLSQALQIYGERLGRKQTTPDLFGGEASRAGGQPGPGLDLRASQGVRRGGAGTVRPKDSRLIFDDKGKPYLDISDYREGPDAFKRWRFRAVTADEKAIGDLKNIRVHPNYIKDVNKAFADTSWFRQNPIASALLKASAMGKKTLLSFSPFHRTTMYLRGIQMGLTPTEALHPPIVTPEHMAITAKYAPDFALSRTKAMADILEGQASNGPVRGIINKIPGLREVFGDVESKLFGANGYIDRLKAATFDKVTKQLEGRHKNWTPDQVRYQASQIVDASFGGLNYKMLGWSMSSMDALRMVMLAPDFSTSQMLYMKYGFGPGGSVIWQGMARIALYNFAVARALNMLVSGNPHMEHPFGVSSPDGKKVWTIRTMPQDMFHALTDPRGFGRNRMNPLLLRSAVEAIEGKNEQGRHVTAQQEVGDLIKNVTPIGLQGAIPAFRRQDESYYESGMRALGLSALPDRTSAQNLAGQFASYNSTNGPLEPGQIEQHRRVLDLEEKLRNHEVDAGVVSKAVAAGMISQEERKAIIKNSHETQGMSEQLADLYVKASHLPMKEFLQVYDVATPEERAALHRMLIEKKQRYMQTHVRSDETYQRLQQMFPQPLKQAG